MYRRSLCRVLGSCLAFVASTAAVGGTVPASAPAAQIERPWAAQPTSTAIAENKTFSNEDTRLSGTLYVPRGAKTFGVVVALHGASSPLRSSPLYEHLKQVLPPLGFAVFVYDRRGTGQSAGAGNTGDFELLADDAVAAIQALKKDPRIDPKRIGVWGLSQGGWLAPLAATRSSDVRFVVAISAPVVRADEQMMFSSTNSLRVFGYSDTDIKKMQATRKAADDAARGRDTREHAQQLIDENSGEPWYKYLYMGKSVSDRGLAAWAKEMSNDPMDVIKRVNVPMLVLYGAVDPVVPVALSRERLKAIEPGHPNMKVDVIADADHSMQIGVDPKRLLDPDEADTASPNSAEYFATLGSWLTQIGVASAPL